MRFNKTCFLLLFLPVFLDAQEWTRFHGANGAGSSDSKGIPVKWTSVDYAWAVDLPGQGHSSPVLWGEKIFITCADHQKAMQYFLCIDGRTGRTIWKKMYQEKNYRIHKFNSYASSTPAVDAKHVIFSWTNKESDHLLCLDHSGNELWRRDFGSFDTAHGNGNSPMIYKDLVIYPHDHFGKSRVHAVDIDNGRDSWVLSRDSAKPSHSTPCVYLTANGVEQLIFTSDSHGIYAVNPRDGKVQWESGPETFDKRCVLSPVLAGGKILGTCGSGGGGNYIVAVTPPKSGVGKPTIAYEVRKAAPYVPTSVVHDGLVFHVDDKGIASCMDPANGKAIWMERLDANFFGSPVVIDGKIYVISRTGEVLVFEASRKFKLLARNQLGEKSFSTPAVANGNLYLRTFSKLMCIKGQG